MRRIDTHQHFWRYESTEYAWINDDMTVLKQDHLPHHLQQELNIFNFDGGIAVQARQSIDENKFLADLANQNKKILGIIGWLNLSDKNAEEELNLWGESPLIKGYRHLIQDELDPDSFFLNNTFNQNIDLILNKGLIYEVLIHAKNLCAATQFCARHDQSILVLDHLGKPNIADGNPLDWKRQILPLASQPHVFCKLSGLITEAGKNWQREKITPYIEIALECFGPERLMFGSDWPVCLLAGNYTQVYQLIESTINQLSHDEQSAIWGNNAYKVYKLD